MVNTDPNIGDVANIKKLNRKKEGNYDNEKKNQRKVQFISKILSKYKRIRKESWRTVNSFASRLPSIMCLIEHHLKYLQLKKFDIENYNLGAHCFRHYVKKVVFLFLSITV